MPNPERGSRVPNDEKAEPPEQLLQRLRTVVYAKLYESVQGDKVKCCPIGNTGQGRTRDLVKKSLEQKPDRQ